MPDQPIEHHRYGVSHDLFASTMPGSENIVVGGEGPEGRWTRILTPRAAQQLWFSLTNLLFPEKAEEVTQRAVTAPLTSIRQQTLTSRLQVVRTADNFIEIIGWLRQETWWARLHEGDARQLWVKLDVVLYPVGWEGRSNRPAPISGQA